MNPVENESFDNKKYWENRLSKDYSLHGVGYLTLGKNYNKWLYKIKARVFNDITKKLNLEIAKLKVLDIGSGTGFFIDLWQKSGATDVTGVDITGVAVRNLSTKYPMYKFYQTDIGDKIDTTDFGHKRFDVISAFDVLYHIVDDKKFSTALTNISTMLNPGGMLILSDNFLNGKSVRTVHQVSRSFVEIDKIFKQENLEIILRRPLFVYMNYPIDSKSSLRKKMWNLMLFPASKSEIYGFVIGAFMYPLECIGTSLLSESPTTEVIVCRKI